MGTTKSMIAVSAMILLLGSCTNTDEPKQNEPSQYQAIQLPEETRGVADVGNEFSFKLFREISSVAGNENVAYSPFSVFSAMSMLANGDSGEAGQEILDMLGYPGDRSGVASLNDYCQKMLASLPAVDNSTTLVIANSLFCQSNLTPLPEYLNLLNSVYGADFFNVGNGESIYGLVNEWVNNKTSGNIPAIFSDSDKNDDLDMAVVNAMYFKSDWTQPFDAANTRKGEFNNAVGTKSEAHFMSQSQMTGYFENGDMQGVSLPFGNGNFEMQLFRTKSGEIPSFDFTTWVELCGSQVASNVSVSLPKFEAEYEKELLGFLQSMGLDKAADPDYGLRDMCQENPMYINLVKHGAKFAIDEKGAEGSASTVAGILSTGVAGRSDSISFDVPFIYIIRETSTNTILFMGSVNSL